MSILVVNCGHWIGYHVVNDLLANDFQVEGIAISPETEDLLLFFGRNSSFTQIDKPKGKPYDACIIVGAFHTTYNINAKKMFIIQHEEANRATESEVTFIRTPFLFGEWMPMDEDGCYRNNEYIRFDSDWFKQHAIYIQDFTKVLIQCVQSTKHPREMDIKLMDCRDTDKGTDVIKQELIEKKIEQVRKHYKLNRHLYS